MSFSYDLKLCLTALIPTSLPKIRRKRSGLGRLSDFFFFFFFFLGGGGGGGRGIVGCKGLSRGCTGILEAEIRLKGAVSLMNVDQSKLARFLKNMFFSNKPNHFKNPEDSGILCEGSNNLNYRMKYEALLSCPIWF